MRRVRHRRNILSSNVIGSRNYTQDQYNAILDVAIDDIAQFISSEYLMIAISKWLSNEDFSDFRIFVLIGRPSPIYIDHPIN